MTSFWRTRFGDFLLTVLGSLVVLALLGAFAAGTALLAYYVTIPAVHHVPDWLMTGWVIFSFFYIAHLIRSGLRRGAWRK